MGRISAITRAKIKPDLHCVTRRSEFDTEWEGVALKTLVDEGIIKLKPSAKDVVQHCEQYCTQSALIFSEAFVVD